MNGFFASPWFFWAGLVAATGPTIIHLLNRRRFRTVEWAAMDFLREAMQRNRRIMQLRDLILLVLRTFAVLLIGLALARPIYTNASFPFWAIAFPAIMLAILLAVTAVAVWSNQLIRWVSVVAVVLLLAVAGAALYWQSQNAPLLAEAESDQGPVHAVLVFDNSLSMAYETPLEGSLLSQAKETAREFLNRLPEGSRVSVVASCGTTAPITTDAQSPQDTLDTLDRIECVDRTGSVQQCIAAANQAIKQGPELSSRVIILSDQQQSFWQGSSGEDFSDLENAQFVKVGPDDRENTWVSSFKLQDDVADPETPSTFVAKVRHEGADERKVNVRLLVDEVEVATRFVTLTPGGEREIAFQHTFSDQAPEPGRPALLPVSVVLDSDRLPDDDQRNIIAPVMASAPVVFIDEVGEAENTAIGKVGQTLPLRRWLAPTSRGSQVKSLGLVRHLSPATATRDSLADARLVVIAGVADPTNIAPLLREYVEQGGSLVIAAGGDFDPALWNSLQDTESALLPAPIQNTFIGSLPTQGDNNYQWFHLNYESFADHPWFQFADENDQFLRDFYSDPIIFQAVDASISDQWKEDFLADETKRLTLQISDYAMTANDASGTSLEDEAANWLVWKNDNRSEDWQAIAEQARAMTQAAPPNNRKEVLDRWFEENPKLIASVVNSRLPRAIGGYQTAESPPFLVERKIGLGNVLLVTTSIAPTWNTIARDTHIVIFGRLLRAQLVNTVPQRNFLPSERIANPLTLSSTDSSVWLDRPGQKSNLQPLDVGYLAGDKRGVVIEGVFQRGVYRVLESPTDVPPEKDNAAIDVMAVNGFAEESELTSITPAEFADRFGEAPIFWVARNQPISLSGPRQLGRNLWWILALVVLLLLIFELIVASGATFAATRSANVRADAFSRGDAA